MATTHDPFRSLARAPLWLDIGPYPVTIPWAPAVKWFSAMRSGVGGLSLALAEDPADAVVALASGELDAKAVESASFELLEATTGRRWWVAARLASTGCSESVLGELTLAGVDPSRVGLDQWCAAVYRVLTRNADAKARMRTDFELELPPPGYEDAWDDGNDYDSLVALARQYAS